VLEELVARRERLLAATTFVQGSIVAYEESGWILLVYF
jgi:hypothetical protein